MEEHTPPSHRIRIDDSARRRRSAEEMAAEAAEYRALLSSASASASTSTSASASASASAPLSRARDRPTCTGVTGGQTEGVD